MQKTPEELRRHAEQFDPTLSWADIAWVKQQWGGKLILKGIMDVEDASIIGKTAAELAAEAA